MSIYRQKLPQLNGTVCITDGGLETDLVFNHKVELPEFAAYDLLRSEEGYRRLLTYYRQYAKLAQQFSRGIILETPTWRANRDWGEIIGDSPTELDALNRSAVKLLRELQREYDSTETPVIVSGNIGTRGDGYTPDSQMTVAQAKEYHREQIAVFADAGVDMVCALTMNYIEEAIGVALAASEFDIPVCLSFTVETDGRLPTGDSLEKAIEETDRHTETYPAYYMINCAHPTHFDHLFSTPEPWHERVKGIRANASCLSHAELDESETLDDGDPMQFGKELAELSRLSPHLRVFGGCCGTDHRHIEQVCHGLHRH